MLNKSVKIIKAVLLLYPKHKVATVNNEHYTAVLSATINFDETTRDIYGAGPKARDTGTFTHLLAGTWVNLGFSRLTSTEN